MAIVSHPIFQSVDISDHVKMLSQSIEGGALKPKSIMLAMNLGDGNWATSHFNMDLCERAEGIGHLQIDLMQETIRRNLLSEE